MRIARVQVEDAALLVVDVQERFRPVIHEMECLIEQSVIVIRAVRELEMLVTVTEQYPAGLGRTVPEIVEALGDAYQPLEKAVFSACGAEGFAAGLEAAGVRSIIVVGIEAHVCVIQTVLDLLDGGYAVFPVVDAISSRRQSDSTMGLERMRDSGATLISTEMLLFEMLRTSKHSSFRSLHNLIK